MYNKAFRNIERIPIFFVSKMSVNRVNKKRGKKKNCQLSCIIKLFVIERIPFSFEEKSD